MFKKLKFTVVVATLLIVSSACDKANKLAEDLQNSARNSLQEAQDKIVAENGGNTSEALEAYVKVDNRIIGMQSRRGGLQGTLDSYKKQKLSEANPKKVRNPEIEFSINALKSINEDLKTATAVDLKGDYAALGEKGKALYAAVEPFYKTADELNTYLTSKAYIDDDFAKAKELDPIFIKQAEAFIAAYEPFAVESSRVDIIRNRNLVKRLKSAGKMAEAYGYEAYGYMQEFLNLASPDVEKTPEVLEKLDGLIKSTSETLTKMKEAVEKPREGMSSRVSSAMDKEVELLGKMRDCKVKNYSKSSVNSLIDEYNRFVQFTLNMGYLEAR